MMVLILAADDNYYDDTAITCKPSAKGRKKGKLLNDILSERKILILVVNGSIRF